MKKLIAAILKINNGKPFIYRGRRYDCRGANYRAGFGTLVITDLEGTEIWPETETTETETTETTETETTETTETTDNMFYAIEIIGYGKRRRYCIKQVIPGQGTNPTNGKCYRTESAARAAAEELGYEIAKCGDFWAIIHQ